MGRRLLCSRLRLSLSMAAILVTRGGCAGASSGNGTGVPVVVCRVLLEAVGMASLPKMVLACLVGLVAHRLVELVVSSSACVWAGTWSQPHDLCVPFGLPRGPYIRTWKRMMGNNVGSCYHAGIGGEEAPLTWV